MATVRLDNVGKTYDNGVEAVCDVTLSIADGEFIVLVGPSGSGKSSVLRMIAGLESITSGEIAIGGRVVNTLHPRERDIAMVFQDYALYPHMTVAQNMGFALRVKKTPAGEVRRRVQKAADLLGIGELLERRPGALSGGQQQRVALGRAIVREPAAFLFDEPLSNLDARLRVTMRSEIRSVQRRLKTTSIYVTHDQEEAMALADRMAVMCDGRVQQCDTPLNVYAAPADQFVASFIGSPPMNFIEGALVRESGAARFVEHARSGRGDALQLPLTGSMARVAETTRDVVLGIRPQSCAATEGVQFRIDVRDREPLGDVIDVRGSTPGGHDFTARIPVDETGGADGTMGLRIAPDRLHLFAPGPFGRRLTGDAACETAS